eukprot:jgi/Galph1/573/GphlegSOOS_G5423.1
MSLLFSTVSKRLLLQRNGQWLFKKGCSGVSKSEQVTKGSVTKKKHEEEEEYNEPGGLLFGEEPPPPGQKRQWEEWEAPWYTVVTLVTLVGIYGLYERPPDTSYHLAREEAIRRLQQEKDPSPMLLESKPAIETCNQNKN